MEEILLTGTGVSAGIAIAPVFRLQLKKTSGNVSAAGDPASETSRFYDAQAQTRRSLMELAEKTRSTVGEDAAVLFETYCEMAEDPDFVDCVLQQIRDGLGAEKAVTEAGEQFALMFQTMEDAYLRQRGQDIRDVVAQLVAALTGSGRFVEPEEPYLLLAEELTPSQTVTLSREKLKGILLSRGTRNGHTAILARLMGIPAVIGLGDAIIEAKTGTPAIVDADGGTVILAPLQKTTREYLRKEEEMKAEKEKAEQVRGLEDETKSGQKLRIRCSISSPEDMVFVKENDGRGIGLFRSEFLYLGRDKLPTEEEQLIAYRSVVCAAGGESVTIRTADIGADKQVPCLQQNPEVNPALGCRGLRLSLLHPDVLRTQLRALYRASAFGNLQILLPMVANVWEVEEIRSLCADVERELKAEGKIVGEEVPLGVMIETPAAALISESLAKVSDFFSIGTNDLTQYTLACDRQNEQVSRYCSSDHEAVLKLIRMTAESARRANIPVAICGELGAEEGLIPLFLEMGISELSVPPAKVLPLRARLRQL